MTNTWNTTTESQWNVVVNTWCSRDFEGVFDFANQVTANWNEHGTGRPDWGDRDWNVVFDGFNSVRNDR